MLESMFIASSEITSVKGYSHSEVILVLPYTNHDLAVRLEEVLRVRAKHPGLVLFIQDDKGLGHMMVANLAFAWTSSPYFGYLGQTAFPGQQWLKKGMQAISSAGSGLLAFNEGHYFGRVAVFGLVERNWLRTLYHNSLFFPGYDSHFGDRELSTIAFKQRNLVFDPGCMVMDVDYEKHKFKEKTKDQELFKKRALTGFDGLIPPFDPSMKAR